MLQILSTLAIDSETKGERKKSALGFLDLLSFLLISKKDTQKIFRIGVGFPNEIPLRSSYLAEVTRFFLEELLTIQVL